MSRYCPQCGRARKACICSWIEKIENSVELIILQHPAEVKHAKGTAKILSLSLSDSYCFIGENFTQHELLNSLLSDDEAETLLLYPADNAIPLESVSLVSGGKLTRKPVKKRRLIVLDGTWRKAYKMYQLSTNLHTLPAITLPDETTGNYRIRKAPSETSLSTVEAAYHALARLDPETDYTPLMQAFDKMIEFQIAQMPAGVYENNYRN